MSVTGERFRKDNKDVNINAVSVSLQTKGDSANLISIRHADDVLLAKLGYKSEFRREFSVCCTTYQVLSSFSHKWVLRQRFETVAFAFSIMGVIASVSSTFSFPLVSGK